MAKVLDKEKYHPHSGNNAMHAVLVLSRIGPAARPAVPALLAQLDHDDWYPHQGYNTKTNYITVYENRVAYALGQVGPDVVPDLLKVFKEDKVEKRRRAAVLALGFLGPPAKAAVAGLEAEAKKLAVKEAKTQDEQWLARALEMALGRIRDPNAIPVEKME
jgi:HEAT repeat protein